MEFSPTMNQEEDNAIPMPTKDEIALCAYLIWEEEGRPPGKATEHWQQANAQLILARLHDKANGTHARITGE